MRFIAYATIIGSALLLLGVAEAAELTPVHTTKALEDAFGRPALTAIRGANTIEFFRVNPDDKETRSGSGFQGRIGGYKVIGPKRALTAGDVARIKKLILKPQNYPYLGIEDIGGCSFQPGVALRFLPKRGRHATDVLLCFECSDLAVVDPVSKEGEDESNLRIQVMAMATPLLKIFATRVPGQEDLRKLLERRARGD
jgi:hypothetical protein